MTISTRDALRVLKRPAILNYAVPVLSVGATVILAGWLDIHLTGAPASLFICAVMFSAWLGGLRPGLIATILSVLAFQYFFLPPSHSFAVEPNEIPRLIVFTLAAFFVASVTAGQRRAVQALRESEHRFRDYAETASDWFWETDADHSFTRPSGRFVRFLEKLGRSAVGPGGRSAVKWWDFATDVEEEPQKWRLHRATMDAHQPFRHFRYRMTGTDRSVVYVSTSGKPVFDGEGRFVGYRGVSSDVTAAVHAEQVEKALHQARAELAHVTRVATVGEVTASLAHEVNQPLAAIVNNANACLGLLPIRARDLDEVRAALDDIVSDAERASTVIQRVRALAKRSSVERAPLQLADIVEDVVALAASESAARRVTIRADLPIDLPAIPGDRVELQQVLLNLVVNGMDAMTTVDESERRLEIRGRRDIHGGVPVAVISVRDRGVGLDGAQMGRLFEAFYTTKAHGMGMGLAISRSIIQAHGGRLWAEPNQPSGATFSFSLPATASGES